MSLNCGIIGLPNVGKSTLFNALTSTQAAQAANYPFCTIEPNIGKVAVPDSRLQELASIAGSKEIIATQIEFVDIAGLVKGASKGEGLGNQFLGHIREMDALIHVLRCFHDENITHVEETIDPVRDLEIIEMELLLADIETLEKKRSTLEKKMKVKDKEALELSRLIDEILPSLHKGIAARKVKIHPDHLYLMKLIPLLTFKPIMYVCNVGQEDVTQGNALSKKVSEYCLKEGAISILISAEIECEIAQMEDKLEQKEFLQLIGLKNTGLDRIIISAFTLLNLLTFFTVGPKETHGWTVVKGAKAPQAAGEIHSDFEKGFIRAETIAYADYIACKGESGAKDQGKMRLEGKDYEVNDGDVFHFRFNV